MKPPTLDDVVAAWSAIPPAERAARLAALKADPAHTDDGPLVTRWTPGARSLGVTVRAFRNAVKNAGIRPVCLPGRSRAIGIRTRDLHALIDGRSGFSLLELMAALTIISVAVVLALRLAP